MDSSGHYNSAMGASIRAHLIAIAKELVPAGGNATADASLAGTMGKALRYFPSLRGYHASWRCDSTHIEFTVDGTQIYWLSNCKSVVTRICSLGIL